MLFSPIRPTSPRPVENPGYGMKFEEAHDIFKTEICLFVAFNDTLGQIFPF